VSELIEVRRHSIRGEEGSLSPEGIELARRATATLLGHYHAAYSSPKKRAIETLQLFGVSEYKIVPEFSTLPKELDAHDAHVEALRRRTGCSTLQAYLAIPVTHLILERFGSEFSDKLCELAAGLPVGKNALVVSHGGSIEAAVLAAIPDWTLETLGGELKECEGALFRFSGGLLKSVELRRL
jgi:broad specificity phosphatase PhoE